VLLRLPVMVKSNSDSARFVSHIANARSSGRKVVLLATWAAGLLGLRGHAKWSLPMAIKEPKTFCVLLPVRGMSLIVAAAAAADVATRNS